MLDLVYTERTGGTAVATVPAPRPFRPMSAAMCHRVREEDAFPIAWTALDANQFLVRACWPADHPFFAPVQGGIHDPMLIAETMRQASMAVIHAAYDVPLDHHFLLTDLDYTCHPEGLGVSDRDNTVDVRITFSQLKYRGGRVSQMRVDTVFERDGRPVATSGGDVRLTSRAAYHRLRGDRSVPVLAVPVEPPVDPHLVGRPHVDHVLLSPTAEEPGEWNLRVDTRHPTLFQRPNDHIPGMLLFEAARQAAYAATAPTSFLPVHGSISFHRYAEFGIPCRIATRVIPPLAPGTRAVVSVTGHQDGDPVFQCTFLTPQRMAL
ncbi:MULTISPECIES: ScbA/BarX family gamma-butyrolactone biosynthesis protein [unclassified Streptomyces]|uniref:ScbA/BarX family gamma-butyrolactone biosynthesis protein n=1 Tax=unclassified Streptomyces TaxID=2593676 RepID=UPI000B2831BD|nr:MULTISPECIES: ScbA/BarX family gamma-butyrolactone biosynthesis protein [unclassified Streptomyces]